MSESIKENQAKKRELEDKILPLLKGYTFNQTQNCFLKILEDIKQLVKLDCSDLIYPQDENP